MKTSILIPAYMLSCSFLFSQNVGIGTLNPAFRLDVREGSINVDSVYRIDSITVLSVTGSGNLFVGKNAGKNNIGYLNTFIGDRAGINNTSGNFNSFFGQSSGQANTSGFDNSFFGRESGFSNTTGNGNSFYGTWTGYNNTEGYNNSFFGQLTGISNSTGFLNSFFGQGAGYFNDTGFSNSFFGQLAGAFNTNGYQNVFFGQYSGFNNSTGNSNAAIGNFSLYNNTTGELNTALGHFSGVNSGTLNNATAIGANARVDCSNCLVLGSVPTINGATYGVNVGIGVTNPTEKLHVSGNMLVDTVIPDGIKLIPNAGEGKLLTSDAFGNARWQENNTEGGAGHGSWGDCSMNGISEYLPVADVNGNQGDRFGLSVSISGNYAIVGAPADSAGINENQGSASTFENSDGNWLLIEEITDNTGEMDQGFGTSVSISGNYAIVGANFENLGTGSVSIYQYSGGTWNLMQKLTDATGTIGDHFGYSVSISGNFAIVGAYSDDAPSVNQGSVSIYEYTNGIWMLMEKITDATGDLGDFFGWSVSISGNYAIVGAPYDDDIAGNNQGSASIYQYTNGSWELMDKIIDTDGAVDEHFGYSVSISGNYAIVGAPYDDIGINTAQGSALVYRLNGMDWVFMQRLWDPVGVSDDRYGFSVFISGIYAIVGAPSDDTYPSLAIGSATIHNRVGPGWQKLQHITDPAGENYNSFGWSVSIDGATRRFIIGSKGYIYHSGKAVFGKIN